MRNNEKKSEKQAVIAKVFTRAKDLLDLMR